MQKKCPKCLKQDTTRYCPACGAEMFLPERFSNESVKTEMENINNTNNLKLIYIKLVHTAIWLVFVAAIFYVLYAGVFDNVNILAWLCIGLVFIEGIVLMICKGKCPFTLLGYKYTKNPQIGFDIFLPVWLAKHNKKIFSTLFLIGLVLVMWRVFI